VLRDGGLYILSGLKTGAVAVHNLLENSRFENGPFQGHRIREVSKVVRSFDLSSDGRKVVFARLQPSPRALKIVSVNVDGSHLRRLTDGGGYYLAAHPLRPRLLPPVIPTATFQGERAGLPGHKRATIMVADVHRTDRPWPPEMDPENPTGVEWDRPLPGSTENRRAEVIFSEGPAVAGQPPGGQTLPASTWGRNGAVK
jgi:hypothetical protein